jgi:NADH:ubiquinone oxidoreductase subunit K
MTSDVLRFSAPALESLNFGVLAAATTGHYLVIGAALFAIGLACVILKRNLLGALMGLELLLNASIVNFVALGSPFVQPGGLGLDGSLCAAFTIVLAAAEAAVVLAIVLHFYNAHATVDVDQADDLKG